MLEGINKVAQAVKARFQGDIQLLSVCFQQQLSGGRQAQGVDVANGRFQGNPFEQAAKMSLAQMAELCQLCQSDRLGIVFADMLYGRLDPLGGLLFFAGGKV